MEEQPSQENRPNPKAGKVTGPLRNGNDLYFSPEDKLRLEVVQLRAECAAHEARIAKFEFDAFAQEIQKKIREMQDKVSSSQDRARNRVADFEEYRKAIEEVYSLDLSKVTMNEITGQIFRSGE